MSERRRGLSDEELEAEGIPPEEWAEWREIQKRPLTGSGRASQREPTNDGSAWSGPSETSFPGIGSKVSRKKGQK